MIYLLDTNICIYIIRKKPVSVLQQFNTVPAGSIGLSSITLAELQYGAEKSIKKEQNQRALQQFLAPLHIVDFDHKASEAYGKIRAELERKGTPIGALDFLIAAHAKSLDLILVTNNEKEFNRVTGLKTENWVKEM